MRGEIMQTETKIYKTVLNDIVFKYIFGNSKKVFYTEYMLELLFNMESGSLKDRVKIINSFTLEKTSYIERGLEVDVKIKMPNGDYLNLEAYTTFDMTSKLKSTMYLGHMFSTQLIMGDKIRNAKPHLQINFVKGLNIKSKTFNIISEDESHEYYLGNYFKIRVINVDEAKDICYNELDKLNRLLRFMSAESESEELEIIKGDEILENIYKDKQEFLQREWASNFFTNINLIKSRYNAELEEKDDIIQEKEDVIQEKDATIEEQASVLRETVKLLHKQNTSLEDISKATKLSIEEIQNIIRKN